MKKKKRHLKNTILKGITVAEVLIAFTAMSGMDSENILIPTIMLLQAAAWLGLFLKANPQYTEV